MKRAKNTKQALLKSALSLLLCFAMLISSTFAWFTDQVTSSGNIIQSGNLKIDMQWAESYDGENTVWNDAAGENAKPVFDYQNWEPGYTEVRYIKVSNEGNLAFKWLMSVIPVGEVGKLAEVIDVQYDIVTDNPDFTAPTAENKMGSLKTAGTLAGVISGEETVVQGVLLPEGKEEQGFYSGEIVACITLHMQETAGNEYQDEKIGDSFNILLKATQYNYEADSFGSDYDSKATYPLVVTDLKLTADITGKVADGKLTEEVVLKDAASGITATIPMGTAVTGNTLTLKITEDYVDENVTLDITAGYDVAVEGVATNNNAPIVILMPKAMPAEQSAIQLFHAGKSMTQVFTVEDLSGVDGSGNDTYGDKFFYDAATGDVYFSLIHFSNVSIGTANAVTINGTTYSDNDVVVYDLANYKESSLTIPADGKIYVVNHTRTDTTTKNPLTQTKTHTWYNINPGTMSSTALKVEKGAKVVLNGVNIRTASTVDALEIVNPSNGRNQGNKTYIYVADGTNNWLTGKSGIGFAETYVGADVYIEGRGNIYGTALAWGCAAFGVSELEDGNDNSMHFNVNHLRAIPMNNSAGIGSGGNCWRTLKLTEFSGNGLYQVYSGGNAASIGGGINTDWVGEIVVNDEARMYCYNQPWTAYWATMGSGCYNGVCNGIYISNHENVYQWKRSTPVKDYAKVVVEDFIKLDRITAKSEGGEVTKVTGYFGDNQVDLDLDKCSINGMTVTVSAVYDPDPEAETKVHYINGIASSATTTADAVKEASFLYRIGNQNAVTKAQISKMLTGSESTNVTVSTYLVPGDAQATVSGDTIRFEQTGIVKVTVDGTEYFVEVVNAYNVTNISALSDSGYTNGYLGHGTAYSRNSVLLDDLTLPVEGNATVNNSIDLYNCTVYGNGFTIDVTNAYNNYTNFAVIWLQNANLDNIKIVGATYTTYNGVTTNNSNESSSVVRVTGDCEITNSYISGCRSPLYITGNLYMENSYIQGGRYANIDVRSGSLELVDVTTNNLPANGVAGFGIVIHQDATDVSSIKINGLTQYNWLAQTSDAQYFTNVTDDSNKILSNLFSNAFVNGATFEYNGDTYVNAGIMSGTSNIASSVVTGYPDTYAVFTESSYWAITNSTEKYTFTGADLTAQEYVSNGNNFTKPIFTWNSSVSNGTYDIKVNSGETSSLPDDLLTATKHGIDLTVAVTSGTTEYQNLDVGTHTFTITYTITDPYNYDKNGNQLSAVTYTKTLTVNVTVAKKGVKAPEFNINYWDGSKVVMYDNNSVVRVQDPSNPSVYYLTLSNPTEAKKQTTIDNKPIYAIRVRGTTSTIPNNDSTNNYTFQFPIFYGVTIKNYTDEKGSYVDYTYTNSDLKAKPDSLTINFTYSGTETDLMGGKNWAGYQYVATGYWYTDVNTGSSIAVGLCRYSGSNNSTSLVTCENGTHKYIYEFKFTAGDGNTYIYYVDYERPAGQKKDGGCVTPDTLITLADGTQKRVDELNATDKILAWDFFTGTYAEQEISLLVNHGEDLYQVANLQFSDGTVLRLIAEHGVFDYDLNKFVYISVDNMQEYVGHRFVKYAADGSYCIVKLTRAYKTEEYTSAWSVSSAVTSNAFASGLLTVAPPEDFYNWIEMDGKLRYNAAKFQQDVETYGLYTYDDFKDYVTYEQFVDWNGAYLKIAVEKGYFTFDYILELIELYKGWMPNN